MTTLILVFKMIKTEDKTKYDTFYTNLKTEIISMKVTLMMWHWSIYTIIISNIQKYVEKGSGWIIDYISISKYDLLNGSHYIKLPIELDHPRKGLSNIQNNDDNECFKWLIMNALNGF